MVQLEMVHPDLSSLPPISVCPGYTLRSFRAGDEDGWCACFAQWAQPGEDYRENWTHEKLRGWLGATEGSRIGNPENLLFAVCDADQSICSTACAWTTDTHAEDMGELGWVAGVDHHRGKGLGHLVTIGVLHRIRELGKARARLNTDDWRVPAIKAYLKMGFKPDYTHESHAERWQALHKIIDSGQTVANVAPPPPPQQGGSKL